MRISRERIANWPSSMNASQLPTLISPRNYSDLNNQEEQLRIWLPESAKQGLTVLSERTEVSMTVYVTEFFAEYLYGHYELQRMRELEIGLYEPRRSKSCAMSTASELPPSLGKSIFALKIFVPSKLKLDLQAYASRTELSLGQFCRSLLCAHLFGREFGLKDMSSDSHLGDSWECEAESP